MTSVRYVTGNCLAVLLTSKSVDSLTITNNTNIYAAVFTTAYARMRLYEFLAKVGGRLIYCDTDSVIYELSPNPDENLKVGSLMGDLTNELVKVRSSFDLCQEVRKFTLTILIRVIV